MLIHWRSSKFLHPLRNVFLSSRISTTRLGYLKFRSKQAELEAGPGSPDSSRQRRSYNNKSVHSESREAKMQNQAPLAAENRKN